MRWILWLYTIAVSNQCEGSSGLNNVIAAKSYYDCVSVCVCVSAFVCEQTV